LSNVFKTVKEYAEKGEYACRDTWEETRETTHGEDRK